MAASLKAGKDAVSPSSNGSSLEMPAAAVPQPADAGVGYLFQRALRQQTNLGVSVAKCLGQGRTLIAEPPEPVAADPRARSELGPRRP